MSTRERYETRSCEQCGTELEQPATGRPRHHCSGACKQRAYRQRNRKPRNGLPIGIELTAELRQALRLEVDRRRREQIESRDPEQAARDRALFADDPGQVRP